MTTKDLLVYGERTFDPRTTMNQIILGCVESKKIDEFFSWGVSKQIHVLNNDEGDDVGMVLKMNHPNFDDILLITLGWDDLYVVRFVTDDGVKNEIEGLYFDQLFDVVNNTLMKMFKMEFNMN